MVITDNVFQFLIGVQSGNLGDGVYGLQNDN